MIFGTNGISSLITLLIMTKKKSKKTKRAKKYKKTKRAKKYKIWTMGCDHEVPPWLYRVWITKEKTETMMGHSQQHIRDQLDPVKPLKIQKIKEKEEKIESESLGPPDAPVTRPPDYEPAFKILQEWVDSIGGPPEEVRLKCREHFVDWSRIEIRSKPKK